MYRKRPVLDSLLNKFSGLSLKTFFKKVTSVQVFPFEVRKIFQKSFSVFLFFIEHFRPTASGRVLDFTTNGPIAIANIISNANYQKGIWFFFISSLEPCQARRFGAIFFFLDSLKLVYWSEFFLVARSLARTQHLRKTKEPQMFLSNIEILFTNKKVGRLSKKL